MLELVKRPCTNDGDGLVRIWVLILRHEESCRIVIKIHAVATTTYLFSWRLHVHYICLDTKIFTDKEYP